MSASKKSGASSQKKIKEGPMCEKCWQKYAHEGTARLLYKHSQHHQNGYHAELPDGQPVDGPSPAVVIDAPAPLDPERNDPPNSQVDETSEVALSETKSDVAPGPSPGTLLPDRPANPRVSFISPEPRVPEPTPEPSAGEQVEEWPLDLESSHSGLIIENGVIR